MEAGGRWPLAACSFSPTLSPMRVICAPIEYVEEPKGPPWRSSPKNPRQHKGRARRGAAHRALPRKAAVSLASERVAGRCKLGNGVHRRAELRWINVPPVLMAMISAFSFH
jgi:hypothetical protein